MPSSNKRKHSKNSSTINSDYSTLKIVDLLLLKDHSFSEKIILFCFFLSGFASLLYQFCWIKKSALIFGSASFATSTVIAVFFGGLALGSYLSGRFFSKTLRPLFIYGLIEISVGVIALFNPVLFSLLDTIFSTLYPSIGDSFIALTFTRFILVSIIVLPPTILIGATLPLFIRHWITETRNLSFFIPFLYAINTLGACVGALVGGFFLMRFCGINASILIGAVINIGIGIAVLLIKIPSLKELSVQALDITPAKLVNNHKGTRLIPGILFFASGFLMLGYEVLWSRFLSLIVHGTIYTYVLTITMTLAGIFVGSLLAVILMRKAAQPITLFTASQIAVGITVLVILLIPETQWNSLLNTESINLQLLIIGLIFMVPSIFAGISYPAFLRHITNNSADAPQSIGSMNAVNTVGGIFGSLAMAFWLIPTLGMQRSLLLATGLSIVVGIVSLLVLGQRTRSIPAWITTVLAVLTWLLLPRILSTRIPQDFLGSRSQLVEFREGLNANLAIIKSSENRITLEIDRLWQGQNESTHQIMAAHIPMISHQNPQDVLVLGLGAGQVAKRFLFYPIEHLTCVDIERELAPLIKKYFDVDWMNDPRVSLVTDDGRNFVKHSSKQYDIISVEIGQPFRHGLSTFYTRDFYRLAKKKLNSGGIVCQFMPLIFFTPEQYRSLIKTFISEFPNSILWYNYYECIIVGYKDSKPIIDNKRFENAMTIPQVNKDLAYSYWGGNNYSLNRFENLAANILCGPDELKQFAGTAPIFTDEHPELEYAVAKNQSYSPEKVASVIDAITPFFEKANNFPAKNRSELPFDFIDTIRSLNMNNILALEGLHLYQQNNSAVEELHKAHQLNPRNIEILYTLFEKCINDGTIDAALEYGQMIVKENPNDSKIGIFLAKSFLESGDTLRAMHYAILAVAAEPSMENLSFMNSIKQQIQ